ncbi:glutamine-hydrolyzing carbamoyl-phosphate synthase small subunit [Ktedonobacter robiniae]|uniref:Carbamoyl phosphate synthase small chain n=1 Tax=Ktedonobacter robiniae TaxID=2778365 RepID=A0ABQ3URA3_9CHLR|nr:glutamine-hydrolyzing carbamoyl-phosphate synthase small subunit [Ktedonobacter robiniae]GHO55233.1 carbamoyl-phosphate synthase small chain [Ktedonobacter robiniae]
MMLQIDTANKLLKDVVEESLAFSATTRKGVLLLEDGTRFEGLSFGYEQATAGEVVFCTGMVGYPEALTDPSYTGEILTMTYPIIGNYGVPNAERWEGDRIHAAGLIVSNYIPTPSHFESTMDLSTWLKREKIPALEIKDTRLLTQHIRKHGTMLATIIFDEDIPFHNPYVDNLVARVSTSEVREHGSGETTIALIDCGAKHNIIRSLVARGVRVVEVPWDYDLFADDRPFDFDGILVSNGPGDPKMAEKTIQTLRAAMEHEIPIMGICLGHQLLALAAGGDTYKLKFGHRSQNQPCLLAGEKRCYITTQNHGFAVGTVPEGFEPWFINANDNTNEGMRHRSLPFFSVQFHPESTPGPMDTEWLFDLFLEKVYEAKGALI